MKSNSNRMYLWSSALLITALAVGCDESKEANETESAESASDDDRSADAQQTMWCRNEGQTKKVDPQTKKTKKFSYMVSDFRVADQQSISLGVYQNSYQGALLSVETLWRFDDDLEFATDDNVYRVKIVPVKWDTEPRVIVEDWKRGVVTTTSTGFCDTTWFECEGSEQLLCFAPDRCECRDPDKIP